MPVHGIIVPVSLPYETFLQRRTVFSSLDYTDDELMSNLVAAMTQADNQQDLELDHFVEHYAKHHTIEEIALVREIYGDLFHGVDMVFQDLFNDEEISQNRDQLTYHTMTPGGDLVLALVRS